MGKASLGVWYDVEDASSTGKLPVISNIGGAVTDLDETLISSQHVFVGASQILYKIYGIRPHEDEMQRFNAFRKEKKLSGEIIDMVVAYLKASYPEKVKSATPQEMVKAAKPYALEGLRTNVTYKDGAAEFYTKLRNLDVPIAIASSIDAEGMEHLCANEKLNSVIPLKELFDGKIVTGDQVKRGKPDPEIFLKAAKLAGINPAISIATEDTLNGVVSARDAGFATIAVLGEKNKDEAKLKETAHHWVRGFKHLSVADAIER